MLSLRVEKSLGIASTPGCAVDHGAIVRGETSAQHGSLAEGQLVVGDLGGRFRFMAQQVTQRPSHGHQDDNDRYLEAPNLLRGCRFSDPFRRRARVLR